VHVTVPMHPGIDVHVGHESATPWGVAVGRVGVLDEPGGRYHGRDYGASNAPLSQGRSRTSPR
jgi:hypothetical protein